MLQATTPILYYSPSIINQIQISNDNGLITTESIVNQTKLSNSIKFLISKLFIPIIGAETEVDFESSKGKEINKQYDDLCRAVQTVKDAQKELSVSDFNLASARIDSLTFVDGVFKLQIKKSMIDDSFFVSVSCPFEEYIINGLTSIDNWVSESLINQLLMVGEVNASAIVFPLSIKEKVIEVKIVCIFIV